MPSTDIANLKVSGRLLHYIERGRGQPAILIHGTLTDYRSWLSQLDAFSEKYRVVSYSRRFAYPNDKGNNYVAENTIEHNDSDLAELIRILDIAPAHLIGHSAGAFIALHCAYHNPKLVKTLVLGEPSIFQLLENKRLEDDMKLLQSYREYCAKPANEAFSRGDEEAAVRIILDAAFGKQNVYDHLPAQTRNLLMDNVRISRGELESEMTTSFTAQHAAQIVVPTLLLGGELSPKLFHRILDILSENIPNTEQITIQGVSHDLGRTTKPDVFNTTVLEFLAKHDN